MKKICFLFLLPIQLFAQSSTGYISPGANTAPNGFTNPADAFASDNVWATYPHTVGCTCPYVYLSWNNGLNYTNNEVAGPFPTSDLMDVLGSSTNTWGHAWVDSELVNNNFLLKIADPSLSYAQGYNNFNFNIPSGSVINGMQVKVEGHGDGSFTTNFLDLIQVNVHYTAPAGANVQESKMENNIVVYPNPVNDKLFIETNVYNGASVELINVQGLSIQSVLLQSEKNELNLNGLSAGLYFVRIKTPEGMMIRKIMKD